MADTKRRVYFRVVLAGVTVLIAIFDIITDWIAFGDFIRYDGGKMAITFGIFCGISTILFIVELRNGFFEYKLAQHKLKKLNRPPAETDTDQGIKTKRDEKSLEYWKEVLSFLLLVFEDFPVTVIIYIVFCKGPCALYLRLFEQSFTAYLSLFGSFVSALWKLLLALVYCCQLCRCKFDNVKGVCGYVCCCCCRLVRPLLAIILLGFAAYLYSQYSEEGDPRPDCSDHVTMTTLTHDVTTPMTA